jgi:thiamine-phosphate pyrophosphorylase
VSRVPLVFAVTDDRVLALPDFLERARAVALGPAVAVVLRARAPGGPLLRLADALVAMAAASGTRVLVHDRLDVARLAGASGVHLPAYGLPVGAVREHLGPAPLLGRSTHTPAEAVAALAEGADYVFLGNIWETATHPARLPLGLAVIAALLPARPPAPTIIAIGGVTPVRAREARAAGARGVAAVRAIWDTPDPAAAARALLLSFSR